MTQKKLFADRHIGPTSNAINEMIQHLTGSKSIQSLEQLIEKTIPSSIRLNKKLNLPEVQTEYEAIRDLKNILSQNEVYRSYIGCGYVGTVTPSVIQRNILENPGWYTQYTPYQSEIAQGRLEALLNFQTMIMEFTGLEIANASMLDEATSAAEAMTMSFHLTGKDPLKKFFISENCFPQTISVIQTRAKFSGIKTIVGSEKDLVRELESNQIFGVLFQYPDSFGEIIDYTSIIKKAQDAGALVTMACDLMSLAVLKSPGEMGADIAIGNTQCFGVPMGFGGPHAAYFATKDAYKRALPGRIVGVSKDAEGNPAIRLALQTREQHIRRDKATSNICTSQVLLAIMSSMYAVYHGPHGIKQIALEIQNKTLKLKNGILKNNVHSLKIFNKNTFNTLFIEGSKESIFGILTKAQQQKINFRKISSTQISLTLDESVSEDDLKDIAVCFDFKKIETIENISAVDESLLRKTPYLTQTIFNSIHSETEMLRYISKLQSKDLSLAFSMIPLGSCTMKLNATTEMLPVTWTEVSTLHPFIPREQAKGYKELFEKLENYLCEITGFDAVSLQPNAGSQGEYAGLLTIKKYLEEKGQFNRDICLIPQSAHGTNPASAVMAGFKVVVVNCDKQGNVDIEDLLLKSKEHAENLGALMITYPSTHGVFEEQVIDICKIIHDHGGQVYMDGANMNAQVALCRPGDFGPDVCHLNLHKTFCIPHGGGGPGMGPIGVKKHLAPFLPSHPVLPVFENDSKSVGTVSAAPFGSASILPISYLYIRMMGAEGLKKATEIAILNANYIASKLEDHYPILYRGGNGTVAHECIIDLRPLKESTGVEVEDVAKRLMDYGFHAPTVSFPVPGTMMIEPTESESKPEMDRFISAMISIREEIEEIKKGSADLKNNVLKNAPHTMKMISRSEWNFPYSREKAVFPAIWVKEWKFWPSVARIDNVYGERNLNCSCVGIEEYR